MESTLRGILAISFDQSIWRYSLYNIFFHEVILLIGVWLDMNEKPRNGPDCGNQTPTPRIQFFLRLCCLRRVFTTTHLAKCMRLVLWIFLGDMCFHKSYGFYGNNRIHGSLIGSNPRWTYIKFAYNHGRIIGGDQKRHILTRWTTILRATAPSPLLARHLGIQFIYIKLEFLSLCHDVGGRTCGIKKYTHIPGCFFFFHIIKHDLVIVEKWNCILKNWIKGFQNVKYYELLLYQFKILN